VISVSYGQIEGALPRFYQERQCREWMKLALQGVSVIFASGDSGVANRYNSGYNNSCLNSEYGYVDDDGTRFSPSFPANCPYVSYLYKSANCEHCIIMHNRSPLSALQLSSTPPSMGAKRLLLHLTGLFRTTRVAASPASSLVHPGSPKQYLNIYLNMRQNMANRFSTLLAAPIPMSPL
jgi:hypothetical protein